MKDAWFKFNENVIIDIQYHANKVSWGVATQATIDGVDMQAHDFANEIEEIPEKLKGCIEAMKRRYETGEA